MYYSCVSGSSSDVQFVYFRQPVAVFLLLHPSDLVVAILRSWTTPMLVEGSSYLAHFGSSAMRKYVNVSDDCKIFLGNLDPHAEPKAIETWIRDTYNFDLAITCKVVIRGRSGVRRGLDALTTGGGPPPIRDAPLTGGLVPHIVFRKRAQLAALQTRRGEPPRSSRLQRSNCGSPIYRFSTSSCPSG